MIFLLLFWRTFWGQLLLRLICRQVPWHRNPDRRPPGGDPTDQLGESVTQPAATVPGSQQQKDDKNDQFGSNWPNFSKVINLGGVNSKPLFIPKQAANREWCLKKDLYSTALHLSYLIINIQHGVNNKNKKNKKYDSTIATTRMTIHLAPFFRYIGQIGVGRGSCIRLLSQRSCLQVASTKS